MATGSIRELLPGVQPSLGCTEPGAIALACALAARSVGGRIRHVEVRCDTNTCKNALGVGVPAAEGLCGISAAAALGALAGDPTLSLEVLSPVTDEDVEAARRMMDSDGVEWQIMEDGSFGICIEASIETTAGQGRAVIKGQHTNVVELSVNGVPQELPPRLQGHESGQCPYHSLMGLSLGEVWALSSDLSPADRQFFLEGAAMNLAACKQVGKDASSSTCEYYALDEAANAASVTARATSLAVSAVRARMTGQRVSIMTSGFSGNQGIVATVPVAEVAMDLGCSQDELASALAASHLVVAYVRARIGELSTLCGAFVASAPGAAVGIVRLLGGDEETASRAVGLIIGNVSGVICDGAKLGCALKAGTAAGLAVQTAYNAMRGCEVMSTDGIVGATPEESIENLGRLAQAMREVDDAILEIMLSKGLHVGRIGHCTDGVSAGSLERPT